MKRGQPGVVQVCNVGRFSCSGEYLPTCLMQTQGAVAADARRAAGDQDGAVWHRLIFLKADHAADIGWLRTGIAQMCECRVRPAFRQLGAVCAKDQVVVMV